MTIRVRPELLGGKLYIRHVDEQGHNIHLHGPVCEDEVIEIGDKPEEPPKKSQTKKIRKVSSKQERRIAEDIGGRTQIASGALPFAKGDVRKVGVTRVEAKFTYKESYSLKQETILKIMREASYSEIPTMVVEFKDKFTNKTITAVAIVPYEDWKKLINENNND